MKAQVDKLDINEFVNVTTDFNNLKTKIGDFDAGKLKTVSGLPVDFTKLSVVVSNKVVKSTKLRNYI